MRGPRGVFTGELTPSATIVDITADGLLLRWPYGHPEAEYIGRHIGWDDIVDVDTEGFPPRLGLADGRNAFISATQRDTFGEACAEHAIPHVTHRSWSLILDYFLDTDYEILQERTEHTLREIGFDDAEFTAIRHRVANVMNAVVGYTWEWMDLGHTDVITGRLLMPITPIRYRRFRQWTDRIAGRGRLPYSAIDNTG